MKNILELRNISIFFGGLTAIKDLSFSVAPRSIFAVIGPNGAGKTTLFNLISGVYRPSCGDLLFNGQQIKRRFTTNSLVGVLTLSLAVSLLLFLLVNAQSLWEQTIVNNYIYLEAFPWLTALSSFWEYCLGLGFFDGVLPLVGGAALGGAAALTLWSRARYSTDHFTRSGIARTFQNIRIFRELSVIDNVRIALDRWYLRSPALCAIFGDKFSRMSKAAYHEAEELLNFVGLASSKD